MRYEIGELTIGQVLDQSFQLFKNHIKLFLGITVILYFPLALIQNVAPMIFFSNVKAVGSPEAAEQALQNLWVVMPFTVLIFIVASLIINPLSIAAVTYAVGNEYLDKRTSVKACIRNAFSIFFPLLWTAILSMILITLGFICLIVPGIYLWLRFYVAQQVVALEGLSGMAALKRSMFLMKGNVDKGFILAFILGIAGAAAGGVVALIPFAIAQGLLRAVIATVVFAVYNIVMVVFYYHCRSKNENYDLTLLAESVGENEDVRANDPPPLPMG